MNPEAHTMQNNTPNDKDLSQWAKQFTQDRKESIEYFLQHGSPIEKALVSKVCELAEV